MRRLVFRTCVEHDRVARSAPKNIRYNSTDPQNTDEVPLNPPTSSPPKPRLASTWNNVVIPSREEVLRNPHARNIVPGLDRTKSYRPDLRYLNATAPTSLASRLAHQRERPQESATSGVPPAPTSQHLQPRVDSTIAQRRAERLAREAEAATRDQSLEGKEARRGGLSMRTKGHRHQFEGTDRHSEAPERRSTPQDQHPYVGRRDQNPRRSDSSADRRQTSLDAYNRPNVLRAGRSDVNRQDRQSGRVSAGTTKRGLNQRGGGLAIRGRGRRGIDPSQPLLAREVNDFESSEDIPYEVIEEGGEDTAPAEFTTPDTTPADLSNMFGQTSAVKLDVITAHHDANAAASLPVASPQWIRETFGGDYSRFAPKLSEGSALSHHKLGPLKHAHLVLSRRKDVPIAGRNRAAEFIKPLVDDVSNKATRV